MTPATQEKEWDHYWSHEKKRKLYDVIASFYRERLIKGALNHFIKKYFPPGALLLHAGCGSGQVDSFIQSYASLFAMDISGKALEIHRGFNPKAVAWIRGNLFQIPLRNGMFDGIYNLGVMEHFEEHEVIKMLHCFGDLLKPGGKLLLLIPPEFGLSVIFFKILKFIFERILFKKNVKFHPDEICRIRSRRHAENLVKEAGLRMTEFYFGPRDFFTYAVVVAERE